MNPASQDDQDRIHMRHALCMARRALGLTAENPPVGAVIVRDGRVIGRGHTAVGGRPHAEPQAIAEAGPGCAGATLYVTLEPCAHYGQTGPCAEAVINAGLSRVVIAAADPDPRVAGKGVQLMRDAGILVEEGLLRTEAEEILAGFLSRLRRKRPHVTLKIANSLDGKTALENGESQWITGPEARRHAHLRRAEMDAILIGVGTLRADDPSLTCRINGLGAASPLRVVLDARAEAPPDAALFQTGPDVLVLVSEGAERDRIAKLQECGVELVQLPDCYDCAAVLACLAEHGVNRLLIEGGARVLAAYLRSGLVDAIDHYSAGKVIGGDGLSGVGALGLSKLDSAPIFTPRFVRRLGPDWLTHLTKTE